MDYGEFATRVKQAGLHPRDCGNGHYRIEGGKFEINWWPFSKKSTIYINGFGKGNSTKYGDLEKAIEAAITEPSMPKPKKGKRKNSYRGVKARLLKKDPKCYWCGCNLDSTTATADHKIPLAKGGTNGGDNIVLACKPCNQQKDNKIWHKEKSDELCKQDQCTSGSEHVTSQAIAD